MRDQINTIFKELDDISQSVNFISLNAHIEASKAEGESGRRFAIVSEEMTKISRKLDNSLEELKEIVQKG
ncbi:MAG: methyl-accepting chemotaxis protein [Arcobacteraceae bacterium]